MRIPVSIDTAKGKVTGSIATSWDDVTLTEYYQLVSWATESKDDQIKLYTILSGIEESVIAKCSNLSIKMLFDTHTTWLQEPGEIETRPMPKLIKWGDDYLSVPKNLRIKELGQLFAIDALFNEIALSDVKPPEKECKHMAASVSVFMYQELTGEEFFDVSKVEGLIDSIARLPVVEVYPVAFFFWSKLQQLQRSEEKDLEEQPQAKNWLQEVRSWISSVTSQQ